MGAELKREFNLGDGITLRTFRESDAEAVYAIVDRNREHLQRFMHWMTPEYSIESAREFIARALVRSDSKEGFGYAIFRGEAFIGSIGFVSFDWKARKTEIGYWIDKAEEGKGIVSKACAALIDYVFDELRFNRIEIHCSSENLRSGAIPERFGFTKEGVLRQAEFRNGHLHDFNIYGLLSEEWRRDRLNK